MNKFVILRRDVLLTRPVYLKLRVEEQFASWTSNKNLATKLSNRDGDKDDLARACETLFQCKVEVEDLL